MSEAHRTAAAPAIRARSRLRIGLAALACAAAATPISGQSDIDLRTPIEGIEIGGRVHAQFSTTAVVDEFVRGTVSPALRVSAGQLKRAF